MKFLISIFALYIMALSMVPCGDKEAMDSEHAMETSANCNDDHSADQEDHCTPFCICSCCASSIALDYLIYSINSPIIFSSRNEATYNASEIISFNTSIWQPPKI